MRARVLALILTAAALGCDGRLEPASGLVAEVSSNLQWPAEVSTVTVFVYVGPEKKKVALEQTFALGEGAQLHRMPLRVGLFPLDGGREPVRIEAVGKLGDTPVVSRSATLSFPPAGTRKLLPLPLLASCRDASCPSPRTCVGHRVCRDDGVDVGTLPPYEGPAVTPMTPVEPDAGEAQPDAAVDAEDPLGPASLDATGTPDVSADAPTDAENGARDVPPSVDKPVDSSASEASPTDLAAAVDAPSAVPDASAADVARDLAPDLGRGVASDFATDVPPDGGPDLPSGCGGLTCDSLAACDRSGAQPRCVCPPGYSDPSGDGSSCLDINECSSANGGCDPLTTCTNTAGSRTCGPCPAGYAGQGSIGCADVNECAAGNGGCHADATCLNTPGSRLCSCKSGYSGDGLSCADLDECLTGNGGCDGNATCTNTPGSHLCSCKSGWAGNGVSCVNDDASLAAVALSEGTLAPPFAPGTTSYSSSVAAATASITVTPTAFRPAGVTIKVAGATVASGSPSGPVTLVDGANSVDIAVTAASGRVQTYALTVTRTMDSAWAEEFSASTLSAPWQTYSYSFSGTRTNGQTGPAGHSSLTDHVGFLRYYPDPMTYRSPFLRGYAVQPGSVGPPYEYDPGHELARSIEGSAWTLETKVTYHILESANACDFAMDVTFGDGSIGTRTAVLTRYGNGSYVTIGVSLAQRTGQWQTTYEPGAWGGTEPPPAPTDRTEQIRIQRSGGVLRTFRSTDGVAWAELWSRDLGNALDGLTQRVALSAGAWFQPAGCYADYDYIRVTTP